MKYVFAFLSSLFLAGCSVLGIRSGYEQPKYQVVETLADEVEIRRYGPRLAAQTTVRAGSPGDARSQAFRILAAYIFGENQAAEEISMTTPVEVEERSVEIGMTSPVETSGPPGELTMRFFMPDRFDRATLPAPRDPRIEIVEVPGETLAALAFSGFWSAETVEAKKVELTERLEGSGWRGVEDPRALFYDPPFTLPFLRRNEVVVRVTQ